jgi:hypothetical protein
VKVATYATVLHYAIKILKSAYNINQLHLGNRHNKATTLK